MHLGHDIDFEDALQDEMVFRVGDRQIAMREEQVGDLDDELGAPVSALRPDLLRKYKGRKKKLKAQAKRAKRRRRARRALGVFAGVPPGLMGGKGGKGGATFAAVVKKALGASGGKRKRKGVTWGPRTGPGITRPAARPAPRMRGGDVENLLRQILAAVKVGRAQKRVKTKSTIEPHLDRLARQIERNLDPKLKKINTRLRASGTIRTATSEHNAITKRAAYRRRVLKSLAAIMKAPDGSPLRAESVRVLGNVLGNAGVVIARPR